MQPLPASSLRSNLGTWAVCNHDLPAVAHILLDALPAEAFDPAFRGQRLETTYFDTCCFDLRKARLCKARYLTLRVRCYADPIGQAADVYALSAKTEDQKWRLEIPSDLADFLTSGVNPLPTLAQTLPPDLYARLLAIVADAPLLPVVAVRVRRYAVENNADRLTLDVHTTTDAGNELPFNVLEFKSINPDAGPPGPLGTLQLRPIKLSKFLWATGV